MTDEEPIQSIGTDSKSVGARKGLGCEASLVRQIRRPIMYEHGGTIHRQWVEPGWEVDHAERRQRYLHRNNGPALERSDGAKIWSIHGSFLREERGGSDTPPGLVVFGGVLVWSGTGATRDEPRT